MKIIDFLIQEFARLPGLGKKSSSRIVYYLLKQDEHKIEALARAILDLKNATKICSICRNYDEVDPCSICRDPQRDQSLICIVEEAKDIPTIEASKAYHGLYHVLGGVISPLHGIGPADLNINKLLERIQNNKISEVIIATNPTVEGDTTGIYLSRLLKEYGIVVSRIALGLPVGGDLEYADSLTLSQSIKGRIKI